MEQRAIKPIFWILTENNWRIVIIYLLCFLQWEREWLSLLTVPFGCLNKSSSAWQAWASDLNFGYEDNRGSGHDSESSTMTSPTKSGSLEPAFERALSFSSQPATPKSLGKDTMEPALPTPHLKKTDEFMPSSSQLSFDSGSSALLLISISQCFTLFVW